MARSSKSKKALFGHSPGRAAALSKNQSNKQGKLAGVSAPQTTKFGPRVKGAAGKAGIASAAKSGSFHSGSRLPARPVVYSHGDAP